MWSQRKGQSWSGAPVARPMTLQLDPALLLELEGAARLRRQPPEALAGELLALALHREAQRARAEASLTNLTPRQREVAVLAARGYTNLRIAEALVVSPETVKTHMRHVLEKLGLRGKSQLQLLFGAATPAALILSEASPMGERSRRTPQPEG